MMMLSKKPLNDYKETVDQIFRLSSLYFSDLLQSNKFSVRFGLLTPQEFYDFVQKQEYIKDPKGIEFLNRPKISIERAGTNHPFDCDDRTILSLAYFNLINHIEKSMGRYSKYETRIVVAGKGARPHHVYTEYKEIGKNDWIPFDPTYPHYKYGIEPFFAQFKEYFYDI